MSAGSSPSSPTATTRPCTTVTADTSGSFSASERAGASPTPSPRAMSTGRPVVNSHTHGARSASEVRATTCPSSTAVLTTSSDSPSSPPVLRSRTRTVRSTSMPSTVRTTRRPSSMASPAAQGNVPVCRPVSRSHTHRVPSAPRVSTTPRPSSTVLSTNLTHSPAARPVVRSHTSTASSACSVKATAFRSATAVATARTSAVIDDTGSVDPVTGSWRGTPVATSHMRTVVSRLPETATGVRPAHPVRGPRGGGFAGQPLERAARFCRGRKPRIRQHGTRIVGRVLGSLRHDAEVRRRF